MLNLKPFDFYLEDRQQLKTEIGLHRLFKRSDLDTLYEKAEAMVDELCDYCAAFQFRDWQTVSYMQDNGEGCECGPEPFCRPSSLICHGCNVEYHGAGEVNARVAGDGTIIVSCSRCDADLATFTEYGTCECETCKPDPRDYEE